MNEVYIAQLEQERSRAKTKMILSIICVAVGMLLIFIGLYVVMDQMLHAAMVEDERAVIGAMKTYLIFILVSQPFLGVGIPCTIVGIVRVSKLGRRISQARAKMY